MSSYDYSEMHMPLEEFNEKFPMSHVQEKMHQRAIQKTVQHFRELGYSINSEKVEKYIECYGNFFRESVRRLIRTVDFVKEGFIYHTSLVTFRPGFEEMVYNMYQNEHISPEEFKVIRNMYKKKFDIFITKRARYANKREKEHGLLGWSWNKERPRWYYKWRKEQE